MPETHADSEKAVQNNRNARFIGALLLGTFIGLFFGLLAMSLTMLLCSGLRLFLPNAIYQLAGMDITAVIFVVFFALGWAGGALIIWRKLPQFSVDT